MNMKFFAVASDSEYEWLKNEADNLSDRNAYIFDNVEVENCVPDRITVGVFKKGGLYGMYVDPKPVYSGDSNFLQRLFDQRVVLFGSWDKLKDDCRSIEHDEITNWDAVRIVRNEENKNDTSFENLRKQLTKVVIGQDDAVDTVCYQASRFLKKKNPKKPLSLLAYGPPGIGKSETAKNLAKILSKSSGHEYAAVWTDLNTFTEQHTVYRLIGSPPGYIGYDDKPVFEAVTNNPYTVFIFDELDKAHPQVLKTFMAILDEGRCASRKELPDGSREFNFKNCIFFFTSNFVLNGEDDKPKNKIGFSLSDDIEDISYDGDVVEVKYTEKEDDGNSEDDITGRIYRNTEKARREFIKQGVLAEIASRFHGFVEYKPLNDEAKAKILAKQIIETGFEYGLRIGYISEDIMNGILETVSSGNSLTVRSFKAVIEGHLVDAFTEIEPEEDAVYRIEGSIESPEIVKM